MVAPELVYLHVGETVFAVRALRNGAPEIPRDFLARGKGKRGMDSSETKGKGDCVWDT